MFEKLKFVQRKAFRDLVKMSPVNSKQRKKILFQNRSTNTENDTIRRDHEWTVVAKATVNKHHVKNKREKAARIVNSIVRDEETCFFGEMRNGSLKSVHLTRLWRRVIRGWYARNRTPFPGRCSAVASKRRDTNELQLRTSTRTNRAGDSRLTEFRSRERRVSLLVCSNKGERTRKDERVSERFEIEYRGSKILSIRQDWRVWPPETDGGPR